MTEVSAGRRRAVADRLLAIADTDLYRRNPFRITGLAADASGREVRQRRQRDLTELRVGTYTPDPDTPLPPVTPPTADDLRSAYNELGDPQHRLVDEVFWLWGDPGECGCPLAVHLHHDDAVLAHAAVLDGAVPSSQRRQERWRETADDWSEVLVQDAFWNHLSHRVRALDDRRLDASAIAGLRDALPRALLATMSAAIAADPVPENLVPAFDLWRLDPHLVDDARLATGADTLDRVDGLLTELYELLDAGQPLPVSERAVSELDPAATRLEALLPYERYRRSRTLRERTALVFNNTAVNLMNRPDRRRHLDLIDDLFVRAKRFAVTDDNRRLIEKNHAPVKALLSFRSPTQRRRPEPRRTPPRSAGPDLPVRTPPRVPRRRGDAGTVAVKVIALPVYVAALMWLAGFFDPGPISTGAIIATVVACVVVPVAVLRSRRDRAVGLLVMGLVGGLVSVLLTVAGVPGSVMYYANFCLGFLMFWGAGGAMRRDRSAR